MESKKRGRPRKEIPNPSIESIRAGCRPGERRATFIIEENQYHILKSIALFEGVPIKEIVARAFTALIKQYDKKHKKVL